VAWLRHYTQNRINFFKIWKNQYLTAPFEAQLFSLLRQVDHFMRDTAPGGLIGEWAKKAECWEKLKKWPLNVDLKDLKPEYYTPEEMQTRYEESDLDEVGREEVINRIKEIGPEGWIKIDQWGKASGNLGIQDSGFIWKMIRKIEKEKTFTIKELRKAEELITIVEKSYPTLLTKE